MRFADAFEEFAPELYNLYKTQMDRLLKEDENLKMPFEKSVFASTAFNFGPRVISTPHKDNLNLAYGWCSITALGNFDPRAGGHLVLPELKLALRFPPGSTVLVPSAAFTHYNLLIPSEDTRHSITQFSAGGLFRWIAYGFQHKRDAVAARVEPEKWWEDKEGLYERWPKCTTAKVEDVDSKSESEAVGM